MPKPLVSPKADPCPNLGKREANSGACQDYQHSLPMKHLVLLLPAQLRCARDIHASFQARVVACPSRSPLFEFHRVNAIQPFFMLIPACHTVTLADI